MYSSEEAIQLINTAKSLLETGNQENLKPEISTIREILNFADLKYYVQDDPVLADQEYDYLFSLLKKIELENPELITADSPTQRIARGISERFPAVSHLVPMLSLENSYNALDLIEWDRKCRVLAKDEKIVYTVEPKYDGAGISLIFEKNHLERGATRGDGIQGEEITPNIKQIRSIPLSANISKENIETLELRGEVVIPKSVFKKYNESRVLEGLPPLANPRNAASGTLRMLDPREVGKRGLTAILYHLSYHNNLPNTEDAEVLKSHYSVLKWLDSCGFPTPLRDMKQCETIEEVIDFCLAYEQKRDMLPFEIDGMVVKVDSIPLQEKMGMTTHHPRWAMAYKFKARQATGKLLRVEFQVGRTGSITPVAKIEPLAIGGVMVSSVSLFNEDVIREKDVRIGDSVLVERAGDVIPYIVKPLIDLRNGTEQIIEFPTVCPVCNEKLVKPEGEAAWRCVNVNCPAQTVEHIMHFASKNAMDIRKLGEANIRRFYELGLLKNIIGIYNLDFEKISALNKFGAKSIENLKEAIEKSKNQSLNRLIFGLGIRYVGETTAKTLANAVHNLKDFKNWTEEQLCTLEDVGPKVASSVVQFFKIPENIHLLDELEAIGIKLEHNIREQETEGGKFSGCTFLFTGTLSEFKRSDAEAQVEKNGGTILNGVSSKLNYLIVGKDAGSKLEKAKKLGNVKILNEAEFLNLMES